MKWVSLEIFTEFVIKFVNLSSLLLLFFYPIWLVVIKCLPLLSKKKRFVNLWLRRHARRGSKAIWFRGSLNLGWDLHYIITLLIVKSITCMFISSSTIISITGIRRWGWGQLWPFLDHSLHVKFCIKHLTNIILFIYRHPWSRY